jgi:hypothetical protein
MPAGRRSLIDEHGPKFLAEIENALPVRAAAARAGISLDVTMDWLARGRKEKTGKYFEFLERYTRARGIAQAKMVERVRTLGREDWRSESFLLERMFPEDFAKPEAQLTIQNNTQVNLDGQFVITVEGAETINNRIRDLDGEVAQMFAPKLTE